MSLPIDFFDYEVRDLQRNVPVAEAPTGTSPWAAMSVGEVLSILTTMSEGDARGDAEALRLALAEAEGAAELLRGEFGVDSMVGQGADASTQAASTLANRIDHGTKTARSAIEVLTTAAGILATTRGQEPALRALRQTLQEQPEKAPEVRAQVETLMGGTYSHPINNVQGWMNRMNTVLTPPEHSGDPSGIADGPGPGPRNDDALMYGDARQRGSYAETDAPSVAESVATMPGPDRQAIADQAGPQGPPTPSGAADGTGPMTAQGGGLPETAQPGTGEGMPPHGTSMGVPAAFGAYSGPAAGMARLAGGGLGGPGAVGSGAGGAGTSAPAGPATQMPRRVGGPMPAAAPPPVAPAATPTRGGPGAMMPPGAHARAAKDAAGHKIPQYLQNRENGSEAIGPMPLVGPSVLGDWAAPLPAKDDAEDTPKGGRR